MRVAPDVERPRDALAAAIVANRLADSQDVRFIEGPVQRRTAVAAGTKTHPLCAVTDIRLAGVIFRPQAIDVDQKIFRSRFASEWMDRHPMMLRQRFQLSANSSCVPNDRP